MPLDEAIAIARQIAEALEEAHEKGIVHRDLKPANVKLTPDGKVKVLDFGLAKAWVGEGAGTTSSADVSHSPTMTRAGHRGGHRSSARAAYMSPEQARGKAVDKRADIWAFGVVLFEMLTGKRLFDGETVTDVLAAVVRQDIPWDALPAATPASVRRLLRRCLDRDPRDRLRDIGEARVAFGSPESVAGPSGLQPGGETDAAAPGLRSRAVRELAAWVVAGLALVAAGMLALRGGGSPPGEARGYRFTVPLPNLDDDLRRAAISPDGRHLTYVAQGRLWLRSLEQADPVVFDGTDGASEPFWSPDSRWIAFFSAASTGSTLKKIRIGGSPAERLTEVPGGWGTGTWSSNGAILVEVTESADHDGWYLLRTGATTMTRIRAFPKDRPISPDKAFPNFLPDGVHFLFTHPVGGEAFLQVGSTDSEETRALVRADSLAAYAAPGFVLYVRDGALLAQLFDAQTLRINGEPRRLFDDVAFFAPTGRAVFSVSQQGTLVVGHRQRPSRLAWLDRDGRETGTLLGPDLYDKVKLSPDGRRLAVSINDPRTGASDIWLVDLERGVPSRLTSSPRGEFEARWSPDGRSLAFSADWQGPPNIHLQDLEGGSPRVLVPFDRKQQYPWAWTPDGRQLLYTVRHEVSKDDLWITDRAGQDRSALLATPFEETQAALSPDGRLLAFASDVTGALEVYVQSFPGGESRVRVSTGGGFAPRWRGDGRELFYRTRSGQLMAVPFTAGGSPTARDRTAAAALSFQRGRAPGLRRDARRQAISLQPGRPGGVR